LTASLHRFGQYTLTARLGRGGMADVYRARREGAAGFERTVVVKKILSSRNEDPQFLEMFINEAKIAARLAHPNIVQVYELGEQDGEFFIAMEYVKGRDLLRLLRTLAENTPASPAVPPLVAAYIARETCRGLAHAHEHTDESGAPRPIVHRDVSPQNIMLSYDGQVKLVDFGIAKALDSVKEETHTDSLKGKFAYMAPEQICGHSPGPQSDLFSTGVVLHEMLTGLRLFKGSNDFQTMQNVQLMKVEPPSRITNGVSAELDAIVLQALERDKRTRYSRAAQMVRDLDVFLQSHRFAVEDMAEYLLETFPAAAREEPPEGHVTTSYPTPRPAPPPGPPLESPLESTVRSSSRLAITGTSSAVRGQRAEGPERRAEPRGLAYGGGALVGLGIGALLLVVWPALRSRWAPSSVAKPAAPQPTESSAIGKSLEPDRRLDAEAAAGGVRSSAAPNIEADVRIASEPPGAQIWKGPKLLGTAPLTLHLGPSGSAAVTLMHDGYEALDYTVEPGDGPTLTLRLAKHRHDARRTAATSSLPKGPHKVRVDAVDDNKPHVPKVQPIDD
jgi:serine/threonine protein kinase